MNLNIFLALVINVAFTLLSPCWAAGELHLTFHMGGAAGDTGFVGGNLLNSGDASVAHGYVVLTLLDTKCSPVSSVLESFGPIEPGQSLGFRIPVEGAIHRYRLLSLKGFDSLGFEVSAVDDNDDVIKSREPEDRAYCMRTPIDAD